MSNSIKIGNTEFPTLLAITPEEQERGLMHHKEWPPPVVSFVYGSPRINHFWMNHTPLPLDIIFTCNGKITSICSGIPYSTALIGPNTPSDLVIELPAGSAKEHNIKIGDTVSLKCDEANAMAVFSAISGLGSF
jgi:uncharacterized membrane protein (UPF0127 family)